MAQAYKCDRCKTLYAFNDYDTECILTKYSLGRNKYIQYDLCPTCQRELERWFNNVQSKTN